VASMYYSPDRAALSNEGYSWQSGDARGEGPFTQWFLGIGVHSQYEQKYLGNLWSMHVLVTRGWTVRAEN